jgi:hypothetical protein
MEENPLQMKLLMMHAGGGIDIVRSEGKGKENIHINFYDVLPRFFPSVNTCQKSLFSPLSIAAITIKSHTHAISLKFLILLPLFIENYPMTSRERGAKKRQQQIEFEFLFLLHVKLIFATDR